MLSRKKFNVLVFTFLNSKFALLSLLLRSSKLFSKNLIRDASWELEENAFVDLYYRYNKCDAEICECPDGREFDKGDSPWDIAICRICASHGSHAKCGNLSEDDLESWVCLTCSNIEFKNNSKFYFSTFKYLLSRYS